MSNQCVANSIKCRGFVFDLFFPAGVQVSCVGLKDSVSGADLMRSGAEDSRMVPATLVIRLMNRFQKGGS